MSYIGRQPQIGNFQICDAISTVNNQAAYTMQVGSVNVIPETAQNMIVSLNGVIQKPNSSYTVAGAVITFSSALVTGDVINFIQILGSVLDLGTPSDDTVTAVKLSSNSVTTAKINNDAVTVDKLNLISTGSVPSLEAKGTSGVTEGYIQLNCAENTHGIKIKSPPHSASASYTLTMPNNDGDANQVLTTNGSGVLSFTTPTVGGITVADQFRMTANNATDADITSNIERIDTAGQGGITGNQMSVSSGIFTFPLTGIYLVKFNCSLLVDGTGGNAFRIKVTTDNSNYTTIAVAGLGLGVDQDTAAEINSLIDVTNTTNVKVKFNFSNFSGSNTYARGNTTQNKTFFTFIRLGDT